MPHYRFPAISVEQAYDVAGYINSLARPERVNRQNDFPNPRLRPKDYPVPAYFGGDIKALEKAKYGPFTSSATPIIGGAFK
ncbi:hypothetical protein [Spartinivicinus poritis]|uniref:Uncharacterized protein n=1 Tax=Spartinivicinus poritis TaxID=2994640 RepID=A0ABT5UED5_9GAMM|nr:hypothetical protein [Spartinivicinus sp. A2-2]MDE1463843.1 hypothetical protein [Spartinivicinus sp. A2-2]